MENNLTYTRNGDYLIPDLSLSEQPEKPLGKYGRMRKAYLRPFAVSNNKSSFGCSPFFSKLDTMRWQLRLPAHSCDFETDFKERRTLMNQLTQTCPQSATDELVDIREVAVDKDLPKEERIAAFLHQIKNPYRFRCGDFVVNAAFASNGVTLEECLQGILR